MFIRARQQRYQCSCSWDRMGYPGHRFPDFATTTDDHPLLQRDRANEFENDQDPDLEPLLAGVS